MAPPGLLDDSRRKISNATIGDSVVFEKYSCETNEDFTECLVTLNAGGGNPLHYHNTFTETFSPVFGKLGVQLENDVLHLNEGHAVTVQRGQKHRFFNDSSEPIQFRCKVVPGSPEFEKSLYIAYGLANDGLTDSEGIPRNFLHLSVLIVLGDIKIAGLGGLFLMPLLYVGAWFARLSGVEDRLLKKYFN